MTLEIRISQRSWISIHDLGLGFFLYYVLLYVATSRLLLLSSFWVITTAQNSAGASSVVVMTLASHARGSRFESRSRSLFTLFAFQPLCIKHAVALIFRFASVAIHAQMRRLSIYFLFQQIKRSRCLFITAFWNFPAEQKNITLENTTSGICCFFLLVESWQLHS